MIDNLLMLMYKHQADYTNTFRNLANPTVLDGSLISDGGFKNWQIIWHERLSRQSQSPQESAALMDSHNPIVIPRNHLVEEVLVKATQGDMKPFYDFLQVLSKPYQMPSNEKYLHGASAEFDLNYQTFCGT